MLHSRVARSNIQAFTTLGARVTVCGPPTLIPRGMEALGCEVAYTLDRLPEADVVYALRMQKERMTESFVPSLREYAARYQIDGRRLGARQVLMHPGPVNRGVELAAEVIDSPQAVIGQQVAAGVVVRMAVLYELLAGRTAPDRSRPSRPAAGVNAARADRARGAEPLVHRAQPPADVLIRGAHVLDPRAGIDAPLDVLVRDGGIAELGAPGSARRARGRGGARRRGKHLLPGFVDPHVHLRVPGQEHKEDLDSGTRAAAAGGYVAVVAMPNTDPTVDDATVLGSLREAARREARIPVGFMASVTRAARGRRADGDGGAARRRRARLHRRRQARPPRRDPAPRAPVPAAVRRRARAPRGGPVAQRRGRHARGRGLGAARAGGHPVDLRVDDDRPRRGDRRLRGRPDPHPAPVGARVGRGRRGGQGARRRHHRRGLAAPPHAHPRRAAPSARHAAEDEPAAARRARPPGARSPALRDGTIDCIATDHAPHAREEKEVPFEEAPMGTTGLETAFAALYTELVAARACSRSPLVVEKLSAGAALLGLPLPRDRRRRPADLCLIDLAASGRWARPATSRARRTAASPAARCSGRVLATVAAGAVVYRERAFALSAA